MPRSRSPNWQQTRKPHSKKIRKIRGRYKQEFRGEYPASNLSSNTPHIMRFWYKEGRSDYQNLFYEPMRARAKPNQEHKETMRSARRGNEWAIYSMSRIKDARNYAARMKKKDPQKFHDWLVWGQK